MDRSLLGPADVTDERLAEMVAARLGVAQARVVDVAAEVVPYDVPAVSTLGRWWVTGTAETETGLSEFRFFVKAVQSWDRSPIWEYAAQAIPPELHAWAISSVPWRTEPEVYRTDLAARLPEGLTTPAAYDVTDIDDGSAAMWLEPVEIADVAWDEARFVEAAGLLGRLSGRAGVGELGDIGGRDFTVTDYAAGRVRFQLVPVLHDDGLWQHPLVAPFADLRDRLRGAGDQVDALAAEADSLPRLPAHGDACPNNLLVVPGQAGFTLIDFGFWSPMPVGFDLSQLLVGDVQIGRRSAADLPAITEAVLPAYTAGLRAEGQEIPEDVVRRGLAITMLLFAGLSAIPLELLGEAPTPALLDLAAQRAAIARHSLDLVEATG